MNWLINASKERDKKAFKFTEVLAKEIIAAANNQVSNMYMYIQSVLKGCNKPKYANSSYFSITFNHLYLKKKASDCKMVKDFLLYDKLTCLIF